jgi:hypothetical protein
LTDIVKLSNNDTGFQAPDECRPRHHRQTRRTRGVGIAIGDEFLVKRAAEPMRRRGFPPRASAIGPTLVGFMLARGGVDSVFLMFAGVAVVGLIVATRMIETRNLRLEEIAR